MSDPLINDELAAFITSGLSITLASRNVENIPSAARVKGCTLARDTNRLRLFISASQAKQVVDDIRATGAISVTFNLPETHRTVQFKGTDALVCALQPHERGLMEAYLDVFSRRVAHHGFSSAFVRAFFASPPDEVAVEFSPCDAFQQTPGPNAGARL